MQNVDDCQKVIHLFIVQVCLHVYVACGHVYRYISEIKEIMDIPTYLSGSINVS